MGIGSFFAALFQKEDGHREIKELDIAPEHKERTSEKADSSLISSKKETTSVRVESENRKIGKPSGTPDPARVNQAGRGSVGAEDQGKEAAEGRNKRNGEGRSKRTSEEADKKNGEGRSRGTSEERDRKTGEGHNKQRGEGRGRRRRDDRSRQREESLAEEKAPVNVPEEPPVDEEAEKERQEKKAYFQAKKDLYQYLNQILRTLYQADQEDDWDRVPAFDPPSDTIKEALDQIKAEIPENHWDLMIPFLEEGNLAAASGLKPAFYTMLLPFYPLYRSCFGEFKYNTFLNRDALDLFRRLTGRKFRLGYRNRYADGQNAFEWEGEAYRVYDRNGQLLCDAVFAEGTIKDGFAVLPEEGGEDPDWSIRRKGTYKDGQFTEGAVEYIYRKPIGQ